MGVKCNALMIIVALFSAWFMATMDFDRSNFDEYVGVPYDTWKHWEKDGFPKPTSPIILRGAMRFADPTCLEKDYCVEFTRNALKKTLGNNEIAVYPVTRVCKPTADLQRHKGGNKFVTLNEYLDGPQYDRWMMPAMRIGTQEELTSLFEELSPKGKDFNKRSYFNNFTWLLNPPGLSYKGTQSFFARGNLTGSHMHWAWGINIFFLLSGYKRWVMVPPEYWPNCNCTIKKNGLTGDCFPNGYTGEELADVGQLDLDALVDNLVAAGVPREKILDYTVKAGDVAIEPDIWPHGVINYSPESIVFTLRYSMREPFVTRYELLQMLKSARVAIQTMWNEPGQHFTMLHGLTNDIMGIDYAALDVDPRMKVNSILDHTTDTTTV